MLQRFFHELIGHYHLLEWKLGGYLIFIDLL